MFGYYVQKKYDEILLSQINKLNHINTRAYDVNDNMVVVSVLC